MSLLLLLQPGEPAPPVVPEVEPPPAWGVLLSGRTGAPDWGVSVGPRATPDWKAAVTGTRRAPRWGTD